MDGYDEIIHKNVVVILLVEIGDILTVAWMPKRNIATPYSQLKVSINELPLSCQMNNVLFI